jgi:hypothetical protein
VRLPNPPLFPPCYVGANGGTMVPRRQNDGSRAVLPMRRDSVQRNQIARSAKTLGEQARKLLTLLAWCSAGQPGHPLTLAENRISPKS